VRNAFSESEEDGTPRFSLSQHYDGAPDYLIQSANYLVGTSAAVGNMFEEDSAIDEALRTILLRQRALAKELADLDRVASEQ
jgi:hypothetical protein